MQQIRIFSVLEGKNTQHYKLKALESHLTQFSNVLDEMQM
jgi:hypothetical protein